jgi:tetratricopeptide (TPR) repeat protein
MRAVKMSRLLALLCLAGATGPARSADPWHLAGWQARAIVEVASPSTEPGVDTAGVKVLCQGRAKADGSDYRVLDAAGKPVPFQLQFHDAQHYSLLSFRCDSPRQKYFVYFGNPAATRAPEEVIADPAPGTGPPRAAWVPHYGFVLQTIQRPDADNPETVADMAKLIAGSKEKYGARYQRQVSEGYNLFGPSDYYISIYRGWARVPKTGKYQFCTVSNEASFSFLDGKELVHWPGRHTEDRGVHGEVNVTVDLTEGLHYLEYYHEEVTLTQMAFLGWRPPDATAPGFSAIPESFYTAPHSATVVRYEDAKGLLLHFEPVITDSIWPISRHEGQYTRCRFQPGKSPALPPGTNYEWDFGDGQKATGPEVEHVYLTLGTFPVTLTATGPAGTIKATWPLLIFEIDHVTDQFHEGRPGDYAAVAKKYDRSTLDPSALAELAQLLAEADDAAEANKVGKAYLGRAPADKPQEIASVRRLLADCALRLGKGSVDEAIANYRASLHKDMPATEQIDVLTHLIRLVGTERNMPEKAAELMGQVDEALKTAKRDKQTPDAYRRAIIAYGDVRLWQGKLEGWWELTDRSLATLAAAKVPEIAATAVKLSGLKGKRFDTEPAFLKALAEVVGKDDLAKVQDRVLEAARQDGANALYKRAEALGPYIPQQVHDARVGAYPNSLREYIAAGNCGAAIDLVDRWDEKFPSDKVKGHTLYWRGKLLLLRGQPQESLRFLDRAVRLTVGAGFETEARWLLANALEKVGRKDDARKELARLMATGIKDEFTEQAKTKLLMK